MAHDFHTIRDSENRTVIGQWRNLKSLIEFSFLIYFLTKPVDDETLKKFYRRTILPGPGWARIRRLCGDDCPKPDSMWQIFITWLAGSVGLFALMFAIGYAVACRWMLAVTLLFLTIVSAIAYFKLYGTLTYFDQLNEKAASSER